MDPCEAQSNLEARKTHEIKGWILAKSTNGSNYKSDSDQIIFVLDLIFSIQIHKYEYSLDLNIKKFNL